MKACPSCGHANQDLALSCDSCGTAFGTVLPSWRGGPAAGGEEGVTAVSDDPDLIAGRYRLLEQLGKGGAGVVYRAFDTKLDEEVAIKILQRDADADGAEISRFKREITTARKITHPNVIRIHDFGESSSDVFISMEILTGGTLSRRMKEGVSVSAGVKIAIGVCKGVQAAHALGFVHRDLKPDNIIFDAAGNPKVVDFGLARLAMASTRTVGFSGTPFYMSPEHANGSEVTARSDVYSLGITFYQLLTGRLPFSADNFLRLVTMHCNEPPPPMRQGASGISAELERVILKALEKDPKRRHANAGELAAELEAVAAGQKLDATLVRPAPSDAALSLRMTGPVPMPVQELRPPPRGRGLLFGGIGAAVVVGALAGLWLGGVGPFAAPAPTPSPIVAATPAPTVTVAMLPSPTATVAATPTPAPATPAPTATRVAVKTPARTPPARTPTPAPTPTPAAVAQTGHLKVTGNAFIEVYVDGVKVGAAPFDQQIKAGAHVIKLVSPGPPARVKSQPLSIVPGGRYTLFFDVESNTISQKR